MAKNVQTIRIESILGGHAPFTHFAGEDQFLTSLSIDPSYGIGDDSQDIGSISSGLIRPIGGSNLSDVLIREVPLWIRSPAKDISGGAVCWFIYDAGGSVYTATSSFTSTSGLGDLNDGGSSHGNGCAYYDNYMYFARDTTIARYGPLDGVPTFTDDYWVGTLGKTELTNESYPNPLHVDTAFPNHVLHRHSDGKLYIADVLDNQGTIHYIKTTKTTVEGDTDAGSKYDAIHVGYGLRPTAIESYGDFLVIAFYEGEGGVSSSLDTRTTAKVAFWDTTSDKVNQLIWVEYPDPIIGGIKNVNGILYFASGRPQTDGFRVMRYIGGNSFEEAFYSQIGGVPLSGAMDGESSRLIFGSKIEIPSVSGSGESGCVWQLGLKNGQSQGIFNVRAATNLSDFTIVSALAIEHNDSQNQQGIIVGWGDTVLNNYGIDRPGTVYNNCRTEWFSQIYKIGQPFKITKIRIPLAQKLTSGMSVTPYVWIDGINDTVPDYTALTTIDSTNFGTNTRSVVIRPNNLKGDYSFCLSLRWTGATLCVVGLPIIIDIELIDVDTQYP